MYPRLSLHLGVTQGRKPGKARCTVEVYGDKSGPRG
jgi:hypothetical protein